MKKIAAIGVAAALLFALSGCGMAEEQEQRRQDEKERYELCIENGGSYVEDLSNGWECYAPGVKPDDFKK
jgi:hypothetical protein